MVGLESLAVPVIAGIIGYILRHTNVFGQGSAAPTVTAPLAPAHPILAELARIVQAAVQSALTQPAPTSTAVAPTTQSHS
jgi:hypothetical protein